MGKKKAGGKAQKAPRCPVADCKITIQGDNRVLCEKCMKTFCQQHKYPADHDCEGLKAKPKPSGTGGGLTVVGSGSSSAKKEKKSKNSEKSKEEEAANALANEKLVNQLAEVKPEELLKQFLSFGTSSARFESSIIVQALSNDSKSVQKALNGPIGQAVIEQAKNENRFETLGELLLGHLDYCSSSVNKALSSSEQARAIGVANFFGALVLDSKNVDESIKTSVKLFGTKNEKVAKAVGSEVLKKASSMKWGPSNDGDGCWEIAGPLVDSLFKLDEKEDEVRNSMGHVIVGLISPIGNAVEKLVQECIDQALKKPKDTSQVMGAMRLVFLLCKEMSSKFMPYLMPIDFIDRSINKVYDKVSSGGRGPTKKALLQVADKVGPQGVRNCVSVCLAGVEDTAWRIKQMSLQILGALAKRKVAELFRDLPVVIPAIMECSRDTKKQVAEAASDALDNMGGLITNAETQNLMPWILKALKHPDEVEPCLDELMDTTFVNSVDAQSLALIIPIVVRGLRDGTADVKLKAATTTGNVCSLVADVNDMRPFFNLLMPELKKLQEHSRPRVREQALRAKESLQADMSMTRRKSSRVSGKGGSVADLVAEDAMASKTLEAGIEKLGYKEKLGERVYDYVVGTCKTLLFDLLDDVDSSMPRSVILKHAINLVDEGITSFVEDQEDDEAFLQAVANSLVKAAAIAQGKSVSDLEGSGNADEKDYLVYVPSIILAFASRVLLKRASLFLERGHRYTVVGMNGVGKSTLLTRIAALDIAGFPEDISVHFVAHEINDSEKGLTVLEFMRQDAVNLKQAADEAFKAKKKSRKRKKKEKTVEITEEDIQRALDTVGFSDDLKNKTCSALSGGWRMKLAIARSMLQRVDLLLLDEPTNHLDVAALKWLREYLAGLEGVTIVLVSHDYEFVDFVSTDIVHLADQKLEYYPCTFSEFQEMKPELVAALPKKEKKGDSDENEDSKESAIDLLMRAAKGDEEAKKLTRHIKPMKFPEGVKLEGIAHRGKPVAEMTNVKYRYPGTERFIFNDVNVKLTLNSRVALLGKNGAGKSTLLKLLVGELELDKEHGHEGTLWKHRNLRVSYISQHSIHHLEGCLEQTPCEYIQARFYAGQDAEMKKMVVTQLSEADEAKMQELGEICEILSRVQRGKKLFYEVRKSGRKENAANKDYKSLSDLEKLAEEGRPHILKLVRRFDEKLKFAASGADLKPLTTPEMIKHLADFGIDSEIAQRKIRWMSGGQKARLVFGASMFVPPHFIVLDEPTNFLDNETLGALAYGAKTFRGGLLIISHHEGFVNSLAKELWHLQDGKLEVEVLEKPTKEQSLGK